MNKKQILPVKCDECSGRNIAGLLSELKDEAWWSGGREATDGLVGSSRSLNFVPRAVEGGMGEIDLGQGRGRQDVRNGGGR